MQRTCRGGKEVAAVEVERVGSRREEVPQEDSNLLDRGRTSVRGGGASTTEGGLSRRGGEAEQRGNDAAGRAGGTPGRGGKRARRVEGAAGSREAMEGGAALRSGKQTSPTWEGVSGRRTGESERGGMASERGEWDPELEGRDWNAECGPGVGKKREEENVRGRSIPGDEGERQGGSPRSLREASEASGENGVEFFFGFEPAGEDVVFVFLGVSMSLVLREGNEVACEAFWVIFLECPCR